MPFLNKVSGGSARKFGLSRRSVFYTCNTNTAIVTLNNSDRKCYYPANYNATATQTGSYCPSGGSNCGGWCTGNYCTRTDAHAMVGAVHIVTNVAVLILVILMAAEATVYQDQIMDITPLHYIAIHAQLIQQS